MITIISLVISGIALLISIITFLTNRAKHNLQQLQTQFRIFCDKFQEFLNFATYQSLINFKYDIENTLMKQGADGEIEFNKLQKNTSIKIDLLKNAYNELLETIDFLDTQQSLNKNAKISENKFAKRLNETLNSFYVELNKHYTTLYDINFLSKLAYGGILHPDAMDTIEKFYKYIYRIIIKHEALLIIKRELAGVFNNSVCKSTILFLSNSRAINKIEKHISKFIDNFGIEEMMQKQDFTKITANYNKNIKDVFKESVEEEKNDFITFINMLLKNQFPAKK